MSESDFDMARSVLPRPHASSAASTPWVATAAGLLVGVALTAWAVTYRTTHERVSNSRGEVATGLPATGETLTIEVVGRGFEWYVRHPGPDLELGTADDVLAMRDVHLPAGTRAQLRLKSDDYLYSLSVPHAGQREIAVPDLEFALELQAQELGTFELKGQQMCGFAHPRLIGKLVVQSPEEYSRWLREADATSR